MIQCLDAAYTLLATLVLLLGVSVAIIGRTITLRLRHRRALELAYANGTYVPPSMRPPPPQKPVLFDTYLDIQHLKYDMYSSSEKVDLSVIMVRLHISQPSLFDHLSLNL